MPTNQLALYAVSAGSDGGLPTYPITNTWNSKFKIKNHYVILADYTQYYPHNVGVTNHPSRIAQGGSPKFLIGGYRACRVGDPISCGDTVGPNEISINFNIP